MRTSRNTDHIILIASAQNYFPFHCPRKVKFYNNRFSHKTQSKLNKIFLSLCLQNLKIYLNLNLARKQMNLRQFLEYLARWKHLLQGMLTLRKCQEDKRISPIPNKQEHGKRIKKKEDYHHLDQHITSRRISLQNQVEEILILFFKVKIFNLIVGIIHCSRRGNLQRWVLKATSNETIIAWILQGVAKN